MQGRQVRSEHKYHRAEEDAVRDFLPSEQNSLYLQRPLPVLLSASGADPLIFEFDPVSQQSDHPPWPSHGIFRPIPREVRKGS